MTPYHILSHQPLDNETRAATSQLNTQVKSTDTTTPANKPSFPALPMLLCPTTTDHSAHLKTPQIMSKHHPKKPHGTTHPATYPPIQQMDTLHNESKCNPTLSFPQSHIETSIDKPQPTKNNREWQGSCHHSIATNTIVLTPTVSSNIPYLKPIPHDGATPNEWPTTNTQPTQQTLNDDIHHVFQLLANNICTFTTTLNQHASALLSHLQCLYYPLMLLQHFLTLAMPPTIVVPPTAPSNKPHATAQKHSSTTQMHPITTIPTYDYTTLAHKQKTTMTTVRQPLKCQS